MASKASIRVSKVGCCGGRPSAEVNVAPAVMAAGTASVTVAPGLSLEEVNKLVLVNVTRNVDLLKKLGLAACPACISGFDILVRQNYDIDMKVTVG
jgi:hypothetical protein